MLDPAPLLQAHDLGVVPVPALPADAPAWVRDVTTARLKPALVEVLRRTLANAPDRLREAVIQFPPNTAIQCSCCGRYAVVLGAHIERDAPEAVHLEIWRGPGTERVCLEADAPTTRLVCYGSGVDPETMRALLSTADA